MYETYAERDSGDYRVSFSSFSGKLFFAIPDDLVTTFGWANTNKKVSYLINPVVKGFEFSNSGTEVGSYVQDARIKSNGKYVDVDFPFYITWDPITVEGKEVKTYKIYKKGEGEIVWKLLSAGNNSGESERVSTVFTPQDQPVGQFYQWLMFKKTTDGKTRFSPIINSDSGGEVMEYGRNRTLGLIIFTMFGELFYSIGKILFV